MREKNNKDKQINEIYDDTQKAKMAVNTVMNAFAIFGIVGVFILLLIIVIWG